MKKFLSVIICLVLVCTAFAACSNKDKKDDGNKKTQTTVAKVEQTTTDLAKIKGSDATELIKSYSAEELSLTEEEKKECTYLTNTSGIKIGNEYYISVVVAYANSKKGEDGKTYTNFDHRGEYYIRYDGKKILKKNMKNKEKDEYTELKVKELKTTKADEKTTKAEEKKTEKKG